MGSQGTQHQKPHAVCIPYPSQGHIIPMMKLAKLLHSKYGFHITFVHTEHTRRRLLRSRGPRSLDSLPSFRFEILPDGLPPTDPNTTQSIPQFCEAVERNCLGPFTELLRRLNDVAEEGAGPRVTCIVLDGVMQFTLRAAEELSIKAVMLWTASACGFMGYAQIPRLLEMGFIPLKDASYLTNGYLDTPIDWIPSMRGIQLKSMPQFIRTTDPNDVMIKYMQSVVDLSHKASAIIINTFDALEHQVLASLATGFPPLYPIGPLHLLQADTHDVDATDSLGSNLWAEEGHCIEWLHSQAPGSVLYINFGSLAVITNDMLVEFASGIARSGKPFLWIIRPDLVTGESAVLPQEFLAETKDRSLLVSWCDQERVLSHPAIGGFFSHGGWNSTLESIGNGLPMILYPFGSEQQTNCWFCCNEWGIGMEVEGEVKREVIETLVKELMDGEKGEQMRRRALEWKRLVEKAIAKDSGVSYLNLKGLIDQILRIEGV